MTTQTAIRTLSDLPRYSPPGHSGTVNVRLVDKDFCGAFEMIHGTLEAGGSAARHRHETEAQVCYVLDGEMVITLGDAAPVTCGPGTVVTISPGVDHLIVNNAAAPLKLIVIYSPPLPPRDDVPVGA